MRASHVTFLRNFTKSRLEFAEGIFIDFDTSSNILTISLIKRLLSLPNFHIYRAVSFWVYSVIWSQGRFTNFKLNFHDSNLFNWNVSIHLLPQVMK